MAQASRPRSLSGSRRASAGATAGSRRAWRAGTPSKSRAEGVRLRRQSVEAGRGGAEAGECKASNPAPRIGPTYELRSRISSSRRLPTNSTAPRPPRCAMPASSGCISCSTCLSGLELWILPAYSRVGPSVQPIGAVRRGAREVLGIRIRQHHHPRATPWVPFNEQLSPPV